MADNLTIPVATKEIASFHHQKMLITNSSGTVIETFGGGTQYTEDVASAGGESLTLAGAVRRDTAASSAGADGDYATLNTDSVGRLWCSAKIDTALPAGTNAIGKLAANDGVDIGDVTINNASIAVTGTFWQATQPVSDASGSLTVDAPVGTPVFVRLSDGAAAISTLPVSIASVPSHDVTNTGTFAVQLSQYTPVSGRLPVDGSGVTQPVSAASLPLPTGAATAAKQPALGTAGTASSDVITVQGIASMTALNVDGSAVTQPVSDASGSLTVDAPVGTPVFVRLSDGAAAISTLPVSGTFWQATQPVSGTVTASNTAGDVAHDGVDSGNPVKVGGKATSTFTFPTAAASGDRTDLLTDLYGRAYVIMRPDDVKRAGVYYYHSGTLTVGAAADAGATSGGGRVWIINPVGSSVTVRIRKVTFRSQLGSALATPTSPRFTLEKGVFTGTGTGTALTAAKRRSGDSSAAGAGRTASTGMTISSSAVVASFFPVSGATAVAYCSSTEQIFNPGLEDYLDLAAGECLILRQADAGTNSDTRRVTCDFVVEEF